MATSAPRVSSSRLLPEHAMTCPYCQWQNTEKVLVCTACGRDVAVPASLIAERDELLRKREAIREELRKAEAEIAVIRSRASVR